MTVHMPNKLFRSINHISHSLYLFMALSFSEKNNRIIFHRVDFEQGDHRDLADVLRDEYVGLQMFEIDVRHTNVELGNAISYSHCPCSSPSYPIDISDTASILFQLLQKVNDKITNEHSGLLVIEFNGIASLLARLDQIDPQVCDINHIKIKTVVMDLVAKASMANLKIIFNETNSAFDEVISTQSMQYALNARDIVL
jgi:hypothetical protein